MALRNTKAVFNVVFDGDGLAQPPNTEVNGFS